MPWWVPLVFIYCLWIGLHTTKSRPAPVFVFFILPIILAIQSFYQMNTCTPTCVTIYALSFIAGSIIGWVQAAPIFIQIDKIKQRITIPGSWYLMVLLMTIFIVKFIFGYLSARKPDIANQYRFIEILVTGGVLGMFLGRALNFLKRYRSVF